jgi:cellulose synthase/poly-beta-1,6-N-acetylglucosamine synthase-like glycosyltransferase
MLLVKTWNFIASKKSLQVFDEKTCAMNGIDTITKSEKTAPHIPGVNDGVSQQVYKPLVSLVVPAYNEASIVEKNLATLCQYMDSLEGEYRWEMIVVNDGSSDGTGALVDAFARIRDNVYVLHHMNNFGVGQALNLPLTTAGEIIS